MAKRESRHGKIPDGWIKQGLQLPKSVADEFKHHAEAFGGGGVKFLGTVAIDLINKMPEECRTALATIAYRTTWPDPNTHDPDEVWSELLRQMHPIDAEYIQRMDALIERFGAMGADERTATATAAVNALRELKALRKIAAGDYGVKLSKPKD